MLKRIEYDRNAAVEYAQRWALSRNPEYFDFHGIGGDCTNFASQSVYAGCGVMNYTKTFGWYYISPDNRTPSWTGVEYFYNFMVNNISQGPYATEVDISMAEPGDIIQLGDNTDNFYHSLVVLNRTEENIYIAAHTNDALYRPLSDYSYAKSRCIHILGAFIWE